MAAGRVPISNVSDTARWVAAYRARETARPDALFRDPLADRLAGAQGHALVEMSPRVMRNGWPVVTRTKLIDDLIARSLEQGCDRVLNLAAGLDTRPYRLALPADFVWVEADLPEILAEKEAALAGELPRGVLVRRAVDLADPAARAEFLDAVLGPLGPTGTPATKALVLTEGLLFYLDPATVTELARGLARPQIAWWTADISFRMKQMRDSSMFENAPMKFDPPNGLAFFEELGWRPRECESILVHARKLGRVPWFMRPFTYLPQLDPRKPTRNPWSAVVRFQHELVTAAPEI
ncbi:methyltransferase (TIGR00027 family) [Nocardia tenerifensis]|uniref:S-adenosyl-L-methionine-dependent methyltransferase n=1 Tax=Nocardia tenerifensis TaxID=228006 RepID=A0A318KGH9_9NOCA|nr:SAM-dependent methyltransferase [Nocardia tenerifensis]PXX59210.1 methyltransferase (TIGR00027 family) [Nocardia tenerifensis]